MAKKPTVNATWKKGRGKLGFMQPLLGHWQAQANTPMGPLTCTRSFESTLGGNYIRLEALWKFGPQSKSPPADCPEGETKIADLKKSGGYRELALIGADREGQIKFWSFTSDGKQSDGKLVEASDIHPSAISFEAQMPAGLARLTYWPDDAGGFHWAVESKTKKGWNRFAEHHYKPLAPE